MTGEAYRTTDAATQRRVLQKTRSWLALGAPLELLSPLSVLRILAALYAAVWPLLAVLVGVPADLQVRVTAVTAGAWLVWAGLLACRNVGIWACDATVVAAAVGVGAILSGPGHVGLGLAYALLLVPLVVFVGLFFRGRRLAAHAGLVAGVCVAAAVTGAGPVTAVVAVALVPVLAAVVLLACAARRRDTVDPDTGLPNGFGLARAVGADAVTEGLVVAVIRISGLTDAREALGWTTSTELLRRAVEDLGRVLPAAATIGRVEGDEVVVALPVGSGPGPARTRADLVDAVETARVLAHDLGGVVDDGRYLVDGVEIGLRTHVGTALSPWDGTSLVDLVRRAALSARRAERAGEHHRIWDGDQVELTAADLDLLADLRLAAERGELTLAYQPQVDATSKRTVAVEALLRWDSPTHGSVSPATFVPLAERTGLIERLSEWVLREALDAQVRWRAAGVDLAVSVNLSAKLLTRADLVGWVLGELVARDLPATVLTLEVTETAETVNLSQAVGLLRPLHDRGVRVSLDDFGCGYTSLAALPYLPLDELKVDRRFVSRAATSPADDAVVRAIGDLAHRLGLVSVAEGVEDGGTAERLRSIGFDVLQGFLYARPLTEAALLDHVASAAPTRRPAARSTSAGRLGS